MRIYYYRGKVNGIKYMFASNEPMNKGKVENCYPVMHRVDNIEPYITERPFKEVDVVWVVSSVKLVGASVNIGNTQAIPCFDQASVEKYIGGFALEDLKDPIVAKFFKNNVVTFKIYDGEICFNVDIIKDLHNSDVTESKGDLN